MVNRSYAGFARNRTFIAGSALLALAGLISLPNAAVAEPLRPAQVDEGAVGVTALTKTLRGTGQGTIVSISGNDVRVVTAKHVATFGALSIQFDSRTSVPARILALIPNHDVAVIEATVDGFITSRFRAAHPAAAAGREAVHVWSIRDHVTAYKDASVTETGGALPDGPAKGRFEVACNACGLGDSGAGVFDARGDFVGVYVGYYTYDNGERKGVAEAPVDAVRAAMTMPDSNQPVAFSGSSEPAWKIARSSTAMTPAAAVTSIAPRAATADRNVASTNDSSADAAATDGSGAIVPAAASASRYSAKRSARSRRRASRA